MNLSHPNLQRVFEQAFSVQDLAQPLLSFDESTPQIEAKTILEARRVDLAGVRSVGLVTAYLELADLSCGNCQAAARPIGNGQIVDHALPLAQLILRLKESPWLFVRSLGQIGGYVRRDDLQQPPARMWLFGIVTLIEMRFSRLIEVHCPDESWRASLSAGRLAKAQHLLDERSRRNRQLTLADCLQFSDKTQIVARQALLRQQTRFESRRQVEEMGKRLEKLRNNLAHAQNIVSDDWETIVLLAENLERVLHGPPSLATRQD